MKVELSKAFVIEAAHRVVAGAWGERLHGHSLCVEIVVVGEVQPGPGWLVDFGEITATFGPLRDQLDHHYLNNVEGMAKPSIEGVRRWIRSRLAPGLACLKDVRVSIIGDAALRPCRLPAEPEHGLPARVRFTFEAAQSLPQLPEGHKCRDLHGHSYRVEVAARDLARVEEHLPVLHEIVDHRFLNEVPGLETATSEQLCRWIWDWLSARMDGMTFVGVQETDSARCIYHGE